MLRLPPIPMVLMPLLRRMQKRTNVVPLTIPERAKLIKDTIEKVWKGSNFVWFCELDAVHIPIYSQITMILYSIHWVLCLLALFNFSQYKESIIALFRSSKPSWNVSVLLPMPLPRRSEFEAQLSPRLLHPRLPPSPAGRNIKKARKA